MDNKTSTQEIPQFTNFLAKFDLKIGRRSFPKGVLCTITSPKHSNKDKVVISRAKGARINEGVCIGLEDLYSYFERL